MENEQQREERLWNYIDGSASENERTLIEDLISRDEKWRSSYADLLAVHEILQTSSMEEPSLRFSKNVMEEISRLHIAPATRNYINQKIIWGIGIFFLTLIVGFFIYGFGQITWGESSETSAVIEKNLNKLDFSRMFNNNWVNAFLMLNIILGLFLLDHYLGVKRNKMRKDLPLP